MYIDIHTHSDFPEENIISIRSLFHDQPVPEQELCSIGIHPWHIEWANIENVMYQLDSITQFENVVAIGETGLDRARSTPLELQLMVFRRHIALAEKMRKPLMIHCVRAYSELIGELKNVTVPVIIHGYRGNTQMAEQLVKHGFYISFGAALLEAHGKLADAFRGVPLTQLFLETDEADNTIEEIYTVAASVRKCTIDKLTHAIEANYHAVFDRK